MHHIGDLFSCRTIINLDEKLVAFRVLGSIGQKVFFSNFQRDTSLYKADNYLKRTHCRGTNCVCFIEVSLYLFSRGRGTCNMTERCPFFKNLHNLLGKKFAFQYPVSELNFQKTIGKQLPIILEQIVMTCLENFYSMFRNLG